MKDRLCYYIRRIGILFQTSKDKRITNAISIENTRNLYRFSLLGIFIEIVVLFTYIIANQGAYNYYSTVFNVTCCIAACILIVLITKRMIQRYDDGGGISDKTADLLVYLFYLTLSMWGLLVDQAHYARGEQMITFYIVQFCFVCFIVMKPKIGTLLISFTLGIFYLDMYMIDGCKGMQPQNLFVFYMIAVIGNALRYSIQEDYERNNIRVLELNEILRQEAVIDDLTKLKNRKALRMELDQFLGNDLCIIMADIDHFKKFNDTYGHLVGDKVLTQVAAITKNTFHEGEVYRYGGDEFLILLPSFTEQACNERIKEWYISLNKIIIPNSSAEVTCSNGHVYAKINTAEQFRTYLKKADDLLYEEKD